MRANVSGLGNYQEDTMSKGTYEMEIVKAEIVPTKAGGEMLKLEGVVQDGPDTDQGNSPVGQRLFAQLPHPHPSHKDGGTYAGVQLQKACEAAGVVFDETGYDTDEFIGSTVGAVVDLEEYQGEVRVRVKRIVGI